jgi:di/tricarboxylate transporter
MNNTPLVAMLMPVVSDWAKKLGHHASYLLMPLSFASILGGACTLIGTSTNLIINGWVIQETGRPSLGLFEVAWIAVPSAVLGLVYLLVFGRVLLPKRDPVIDVTEDAREYTVELIVEHGSPLVGKSVGHAGLRNLPGLYLAEIERKDQVLPAVSGNIALAGGDRLVFVGVVESVVDLQRIRGLAVADDQLYKLDDPRENRIFVEAVVSDSCPLVGMTIREGRFRTHYHAVVIAVARNGERLQGKLGDIRLRTGDTLLLEARASFAENQRNSRDFFLVSQVDGMRPPAHGRAPVALGLLLAMVAVVTTGWVSMLEASMLTAGAMHLSGCVKMEDARAAIDWRVLIVIAGSLALGRALAVTGLAEQSGELLLSWLGDDPRVALAAVYGLTMVLSAAVSAKAAAVLVLPVCQAVAASIGADLMPFVLAVMMAASTSVATPIGYPTNLMIMGPGSYRYVDYLKLGVPLSLMLWALAVALIPLIWPFAV